MQILMRIHPDGQKITAQVLGASFGHMGAFLDIDGQLM